MRRGLVALAVLMGVGLLLQLGCNGTSFQGSSNGGGSAQLAIFGGDAPECSVLSFQVDITGVTLTPQGGGTPVTVVSSSSPITVDFAALTGFNTILNTSTVRAGTYTQANISLTNPQITILDTTVSPPIAKTITTTFASGLATATVSPNINPVLTIEANVAQGLILDFKLRKSIQTDSSGNITGVVNPTFGVHPSVVTTVKGLGEIDDLHGTVQSVSTTSTNSNFTGSFTLELSSGRTLLVNTTSKTDFEKVSGLSGLAAGMFVEVEAHVDAQGNIVAGEVEVEEPLNLGFAILVGPVTSVSPSLGAASSFTMFVREEFPDVSNVVPLRSMVTINITTNTIMRIAFPAQAVNEAGLTFNQTTLTQAQHVAVAVPISGNTPVSTFNALGVILRQHGYVGNLTGTPTISASSNLVGMFTLTLCSPTLEGEPITVVTFPDTDFDNGLTDLTSLTSTQTLVVRGLLFYETGPLTINGMAVATPGWVLEAGVVSQLQ
jgi:uncharacterized protein DUF4382/uncharacterized protein DUF5666